MQHKNSTLPRAILLIVVSICFSSTAAAFSWRDLWQRPDQQGAAAMQAGQPAQAAQLYVNPHWQAVAHYRAAQYQQAYQSFSQDKSATGYFNQGNALANMGQFDKAIQAYTQALRLNPNMADAAYNKNLLEKMQQQSKQNKSQNKNGQKNNSDQQQKNNDQQQNQNQDQQQNNNDQQQNKDQQQNNNDQQQDKDQQQNDNDQQQNQNQRQNDNDQQQNQDSQQGNSDQQQNQDKQQNNSDPQQNRQSADANQTAIKAGNTSQQTAQQQATQQWLQSIPDDPGGLLKQKFLRDHAKYQQTSQQGQ